MMQLGKKQAAGFVEDDATVFGEASERDVQAAGDAGAARAEQTLAGQDAAAPVTAQAPGTERAAAR